MTDLYSEIKAADPEILNRKIERWDDLNFTQLEPFVKEMLWRDNTSINVFSVVGTQHADYAGLPSWTKLLEVGKRMPRNLRLFQENPDYYYQNTKKQPSMYYRTIDGKNYYVGADGNHRTAIAKAAFFIDKSPVLLHGVTVNSYIVDYELKTEYDEILKIAKERKLSVYISVGKTAISREDGDGWMSEKYKAIIRIEDFKTGKVHIISTTEESAAFKNNLKKSFFRRLFGI
ncbi:MAG: hypothetical protein ACYDDE_03965 [bacterium]